MKYLLHALAVSVGLLSLPSQQGLASELPNSSATQIKDCGIETACSLGNRSYHVRAPDGWNGKTALPILLHFHGWGRQGKLIMKHGRIAGATRKLGVLLVAPNGEGRT